MSGAEAALRGALVAALRAVVGGSGVPELAGTVYFIAAKAKIGGGSNTVVIPNGFWASVCRHFSPFLRRVVLIGQPARATD